MLSVPSIRMARFADRLGDAVRATVAGCCKSTGRNGRVLSASYACWRRVWLMLPQFRNPFLWRNRLPCFRSTPAISQGQQVERMKHIVHVTDVYDLPYRPEPSRNVVRHVDLRQHPDEITTIPELKNQPVLTTKDQWGLDPAASLIEQAPGCQDA